MNVLRHWWWLMLLGPIAAAIPAALLVSRAEDTYRSSVTLLVTNQVEASERLTNTYAELIELRPVLATVNERVRLGYTEDELRAKISVSAEFSSQLIRISVKDPDPEIAASIANTTATAFLQLVEVQVGRADTVKVVELAVPAESPTHRSLALSVGLASALGLLVAASVAIGLESIGQVAKQQ